MSKKLFIIFLILFSACAKDYIDKEDESTQPTAPLSVKSVNVNVDTISFVFEYASPEKLTQLQVQRDTEEVPLTHYDGETVFFSNIVQSGFLDYRTSIDEPSLSQNTKYHYSVFYRDGSFDSPPKRLNDYTLTTLTYKEGMRNLLNSLFNISKTYDSGLDLLISSELAILLFNQEDTKYELLDTDLFFNLDGLLIPSLMYKSDTVNQDATLRSTNEELIALLKNHKRVLSVDYCTNPTKINNSITNSGALDIVGFVRPLDSTNFFANLSTTIQSKDESTSITSIDSTNLKNFIFIDFPLSGADFNTLKSKPYDLIIISPFSSNDWNDLYSNADVTALKVKDSVENSSRLVYAYIDISKIWKTNPYYWKPIWNDDRPDWIPKQIGVTNSFYIKYWRDDWVAILQTLIPTVISKNYDGIVFGGGEGF